MMEDHNLGGSSSNQDDEARLKIMQNMSEQEMANLSAQVEAGQGGPNAKEQLEILQQMRDQEMSDLRKLMEMRREKEPRVENEESGVSPVAESVSTVKPSPETQIPCPKCGRPTSLGANFCGWCGFNLRSKPEPETTLPCPSCGRSTRPGANFCGWCGFKLK